MRFRPVLFSVMVTVTCGGFFACGSRTALPGDFDAVGSGNDDSGSDARKPRDSGPDTAIPPIDARVPFDASRLDCPDAGATLIYLITSSNQLLSFYPPAASFTLVGTISCPDTNTVGSGPAAPFSMAVDRRGTAYVEFNDGNLFKVSTLTAACAATPFVAQTGNFIGFGMGFSTNGAGPDETLFIAGGQTISTTANTDFASISLPDYSVNDIGPFNPQINDAELAGTGDGRLFAMSAFDTVAADTTISEIDKTTGNVTGSDTVPGVIFGGAWAFGFWGGDFYTFTQPNGQSDPTAPSVVTQYDPSSKNATVVASYPNAIVGAGVSTCAPQE